MTEPTGLPRERPSCVLEDFLREIEDLVESEEALHAMCAHSPAGHLLLNRRGVILCANLTARFLFRRYRVPLVGCRLYDFIDREHRDALFLHLRRPWKGGRPNRLEIRLRSDEEAWIRLESRADWPSEMPRLVSVHPIDATEQRRLSQALERERGRLRAVPDRVPTGVFIGDGRTGRLEPRNRMAEEMPGGFSR